MALGLEYVSNLIATSRTLGGVGHCLGAAWQGKLYQLGVYIVDRPTYSSLRIIKDPQVVGDAGEGGLVFSVFSEGWKFV